MSDPDKKQTVLVTGGTGFVAVHCILQLLKQDYSVKTTVRSHDRQEMVISMLRFGGIESFDRLHFIVADLLRDDQWADAVKDCAYVLHVASPVSLAAPKDEQELIRPAVEGTLRVLKAARDAGVQRVVMTSNFGAVGYSHRNKNQIITEESWTDPNEPGLSSYNKSKVLAERAAWDFIKSEGGGMELAVVNPVGIFGPSLGPELSGGFKLLRGVLDGTMKVIPNMTLGVVDVRDVADLHLRAMTNPAAKGQRFLAVAGETTSLPEIAVLLKSRLGDAGRLVSTRRIPDWVVRITALYSPTSKGLVPMLSRYRDASNEKARKTLGWIPRSNEEAILATADSLLRFGAIKGLPTKQID